MHRYLGGKFQQDYQDSKGYIAEDNASIQFTAEVTFPRVSCQLTPQTIAASARPMKADSLEAVCTQECL